jgi:hypothetical protein
MNFKEYKPFGIIFILCLITGLVLTGCGDYYDEGDHTAEQRFDKFTSQEKTLYKAVQDQWGQKRLIYVREAVGRREARPAENKLPFSDIANVIKSNNSAALKLDAAWQPSNKNKYIKARWDRVDEKWYRELMLSMGVTEVIKQELVPEPVVEVIDDSSDDSEPDTYGDQPWIAPQKEVVKVNLEDLIPKSQYDELYYEIKECPEAIDRYNSMIDDRLLTWLDYQSLIIISIKCKAVNIGEKF